MTPAFEVADPKEIERLIRATNDELPTFKDNASFADADCRIGMAPVTAARAQL